MSLTVTHQDALVKSFAGGIRTTTGVAMPIGGRGGENMNLFMQAPNLVGTIGNTAAVTVALGGSSGTFGAGALTLPREFGQVARPCWPGAR